jgi:hypothetical protein
MGLLFHGIASPVPSIKTHSDDIGLMSNLLGLSYLVCFDVFVVMIFGQIMQFPKNQPVLHREVDNNMYRPTAYFLAQSMTAFLLMWFYPFVVTLFSYWLYGFRNHAIGDFFAWALSLACLGYCGAFFGLIAGTFFSDLVRAMTTLTSVVAILNLGSGLYTNLASTTNALVWLITLISPMRYGCEI